MRTPTTVTLSGGLVTGTLAAVVSSGLGGRRLGSKRSLSLIAAASTAGGSEDAAGPPGEASPGAPGAASPSGAPGAASPSDAPGAASPSDAPGAASPSDAPGAASPSPSPGSASAFVGCAPCR